MDKLLYTVPEAADRLGIGRSRLYCLITAGEVATCKIGRSRRIHVADLEAFAARLAGHDAPEPRQAP